MPEIGATLREARMRQRIDISEVEAETKIRAKYLRALENEEWDLLPGPTFVKSFLRTYADALGLDGKLLVEEYKLRHERLSEVDLQPIAPPGAARRPAASGRAIPRGWIVALRRRRGDRRALRAGARQQHSGGSAGNSAQTSPPSASETGGAAAGTASTKKKKKAKPKPQARAR